MLEVIVWITENRQDCIKFNLDIHSENHIAECLEMDSVHGYTRILLSYGILLLLALLDYYTYYEEYGRCGNIISAIKACNEKYKEDLPTTLDDERCRELMSMTVKEALDSKYGREKK